MLDNEAPGTQILRVLGKDEIDIVTLQMGKGLDHTVRRHDGDVLQHQRFEPLVVRDMRREGNPRVHDQGVWAEVEEVGGMRILGHGMSHRWHRRPASGCVIQGV